MGHGNPTENTNIKQYYNMETIEPNDLCTCPMSGMVPRQRNGAIIWRGAISLGDGESNLKDNQEIPGIC